MPHYAVPFTLSSQAVNGTTFTVNYPAGVGQSTSVGGAFHYLIDAAGVRKIPNADFTVSYGTSSVTVTARMTIASGTGTFWYYTDAPVPDGLFERSSQCEDYGASPAASAAANTAAIQAALSGGGMVTLSTPGTYFVTGPIVISKPLRFVCIANSDGYASTNLNTGVNGSQPALYSNESRNASVRIATTQSTGNLFEINSHGVTFEGVHIENQSVTEPTSGSAIRVGTTGSPANGFGMIGCSTYRNYIDIDFSNSVAWTVSNCRLIGWVKYGIRVNNSENFDESDALVIGNWIMSGKNAASPDAGIYWQSGGGLRVIGNKISRIGATAAADAVRLKKGIWINPSNGVTTSVFIITGNSIEACNEDNILLDTTLNGGSIGIMTIVGNEFNCSPSSLVGANPNYTLRALSDVQLPFTIVFSGNAVNGCTSMIYSNLAYGINLGPNSINGDVLRGALIDIENGVGMGYKLDDQIVKDRPADMIMLLDKTGTNYNSNSQRNATNRRIVREMPAFTGGASAPISKNLFAVDIGSNSSASACEIELTFAGFLSGPGAHMFRIKRILYGNGSGTAVASTPAGWSDYHYTPGGTPTTQAYFTFTFTNSSGLMTIAAVTANGVGSPVLNASPFAGIASGEVVLTINGMVRQVNIS